VYERPQKRARKARLIAIIVAVIASIAATLTGSLDAGAVFRGHYSVMNGMVGIVTASELRSDTCTERR
jgi:hypothetical protein